MQVKDIENALKALEERIVNVSVPEKHEIRMKKIYKHMKERYISDTSLLAAKSKNLRIDIQLIKSKQRLKDTILREIEDSVAAIEKDMQLKKAETEMRRMEFKRSLVELKTKQDEEEKMLKIQIVGDVRRAKAKTDQTEQETNEVQPKLDVRRVEALTARGAKGFLQESVKNSIPTQRAIQKLQEADMLRDPIELTNYWMGLNDRTDEIIQTKKEMEEKIILRTKQLEALEEEEKEAGQSIHLFIHKEEEINLWDIQEKIEEATRIVSSKTIFFFFLFFVNTKVMQK